MIKKESLLFSFERSVKEVKFFKKARLAGL